MTKCQAAYLRAIANWWQRHGESPTYRELAEEFTVKVETSYGHVQRLRDLGWVAPQLVMEWRSIRLTEAGQDALLSISGSGRGANRVESMTQGVLGILHRYEKDLRVPLAVRQEMMKDRDDLQRRLLRKRPVKIKRGELTHGQKPRSQVGHPLHDLRVDQAGEEARRAEALYAGRQDAVGKVPTVELRDGDR